MRCRACGQDSDHVLDSRPVDHGSAVRRRRECLACHNRHTTFESVPPPVSVEVFAERCSRIVQDLAVEGARLFGDAAE